MPFLRVDEAGLAGTGVQLVGNGMQGVSQSMATLTPAGTIVPSGVDEVSAMAAPAWNVQTAAMQAVNAFAQQEIVRLGAVVGESVAAYSNTDSANAASVI